MVDALNEEIHFPLIGFTVHYIVVLYTHKNT